MSTPLRFYHAEFTLSGVTFRLGEHVFFMPTEGIGLYVVRDVSQLHVSGEVPDGPMSTYLEQQVERRLQRMGGAL
jgi:hypothetical protein